MNKILASVIALLFMIALNFNVIAAEMEARTTDAIVNEIMQQQGIQSAEQIDPDKVSQTLLEELGDAVMEAMIGNSVLHEQMDAEMGGEGSASLAAFHTRLGYNYLVGYPNGMMALMSSGMMNTGRSNFGMMNYWDNYSYPRMMGGISWGGMIMGIVIFFIVVILIVALIGYSKKSSSSLPESPEVILKKRFASGEINQEEYEKMIAVLRK